MNIVSPYTMYTCLRLPRPYILYGQRACGDVVFSGSTVLEILLSSLGLLKMSGHKSGPGTRRQAQSLQYSLFTLWTVFH